MNLVLIGGGGHCTSCIEVIEVAGLALAGVLDPEPAEQVCGVQRLGDDSWLDSEGARDVAFLVTVGQVAVAPLRARLYAALVVRGLRVATVVAPSALVSRRAVIGEGSVVMQRAVINADATVGRNCIINTGALVEHHAQVGDHCHISTGAIVNGGARVGDGCMVGSGAVLLHGVSIVAGCTIGAGAVVTAPITEPGTWVGVPARRLT